MKNFDFRPAPFWFLNHDLQKEEICEQLDLMRESGISGIFLHPRAGNYYQTYGSKEWFEMVRYIVAEAEKRQLKVWIYDEDPYPSGAAGGRVFFENPEFAARRMRLIEARAENGILDVKLGQCKVLCAVAVRTEDDRIVECIDLYASVGTIRDQFFKSEWNSPYYCDMMGKMEFPHVRAETFYPQMAVKTHLSDEYIAYFVVAELYYSDDKYGFKPDNLNKACTDTFIRLTHEKYAEYIGTSFGKNTLGIFTDEPSPGAFLPYTDRLFQKFQKRYGYSLQENLYRLFVGRDSYSQKIRLDYYRLINDLVTKNFYKNLHDWCKKHGLLMTGHIVSEEDLIAQTLLGENVYHSVRYFDIPGFDITGNNLGDNDHFALCIGGKIVSSAAHQAGKKIIMSELFSNSPYNYDLAGMNRLSYFMYALGINFFVPHGFHYSIDGYRKFDAGTSLFYQFKQFGNMPEFCKMAEKFGRLLSEGKHVCNTCIVLPMHELYRWVSVDTEYAIRYAKKVIAAAKYLTNRYVEYDFIDDDTFYNSPVANGKMVVGKETYKNVILFRDLYEEAKIHTLSELNLIDIDALGREELIDAERAEIFAVNGDVSRLMVLKRKRKGKILYYLFNNGKQQIEFILDCRFPYARIILPYAQDQFARLEDGKLTSVMDGYECMIVEECAEMSEPEYRSVQYSGKIKNYDWMENPEWDYKLPAEKSIWIQKYDITVERDGKQAVYPRHDYCLVREVYGTKRDYLKGRAEIPVFDTLGIKEIELYPVKAVYTAEFIANKKYSHILIEGETFRGNCKLYLNGQNLPLEQFEKARIYDFNNRIFEVQDILIEGKNELRIVFEQADEFDGICSMIHFVTLDDKNVLVSEEK